MKQKARTEPKDFGPPINWVKNEPGKYKTFWDGSRFLFALQVKNNALGTTRWEFDVLEFDCDGEGASLRYPDGEYYDSWTWDAFEYFALLDGQMPGEEAPEEHEW